MKLSPDSRGTLIVRPQGGVTKDPLAIPRRIQIIDGTLALVTKGFGELKYALPVGIYRIQIESRSSPFEITMLVRPDVETVVEYPETFDEKLPSSVPIPGSQAMHETVYAPFIRAWENLCSRADPQKADILLVFTAENANQTFNFSRICLRNDQGQILAQIKRRARIAAASQCATAHLRLKPGSCILEWPHETELNQRYRQPLWAPQAWCTIVFLGVQPETGRINAEKLSIYHWNPRSRTSHLLSRQVSLQAGYDEYNFTRSIQDTELAQQSLLTRRQLVSFQQQQQMLMEKYENPMLGILGCHMLIQRDKKDRKLILTVLQNLDRLVPGHPDVEALKIMAQGAGLDLHPALQTHQQLSAPPMLRAGLAAVISQDWSLDFPLIAPGSLIDIIRSRVPGGGLWTCWQGTRGRRTPEIQKGGRNGLARVRFSDQVDFRKMIESMDPTSIKVPLLEITASYPPHLIAQVRNYIGMLKQASPEIQSNQMIDHLRWTGLSRCQIRNLLESIHYAENLMIGALKNVKSTRALIKTLRGRVRLYSRSQSNTLSNDDEPASIKSLKFKSNDPPAMGSAEF